MTKRMEATAAIATGRKLFCTAAMMCFMDKTDKIY